MIYPFVCTTCGYRQEQSAPMTNPPAELWLYPHADQRKAHTLVGDAVPPKCPGTMRREYTSPRLTVHLSDAKHADAYEYYTGYSGELGRTIASQKFGSQAYK